MKKRFNLSVAEFAIPSPRTGSIDTYSGFNVTNLFGMELHQEIQAQRHRTDPHYESEVWCGHAFKKNRMTFDVIGKMDGFYYGSQPKIEEIKTTLDVKKLHQSIIDTSDHPYLLQIKTYGYLHWLKSKTKSELCLHLVSVRNKKHMDFIVDWEIDDYENWLSRRLQTLVDEIKTNRARSNARVKKAIGLQFPFEEPRKGQEELMASIEEGFKGERPMLLQAPTGLGKTMGVLYPALKDALGRGQKVIYLTPKNSQHHMVLSAITKLRQTKVPIKALMLTAKRKLCLKREPLCNAKYCEFAEHHYTKMTDGNVVKVVQKQKKWTSQQFKKVALKYQVCPYELQMQLVSAADVVIGDYNYVFSPRVGSPITRLALGEDAKPNVIIDEIHNLPTRAMDYYSINLSALLLERLLFTLENLPETLREKWQRLIQEGVEIIHACGDPQKKHPHVVTPNIKKFIKHEQHLREFLASYLESDALIGEDDVVLMLYNAWHDFTAGLAWAAENENVFFISYLPNDHELKITCCDASQFLAPLYQEMQQVVGFSATLKPFEFYRQLVGLPAKKLLTEEFQSPFPKTKRKIIIIPQLSSKYYERHRQYPRISDAIYRICALRQGNYLAFFPSFSFLDKVASIFKLPPGFHLMQQTRKMRQEDFKSLLEQLRNQQQPNIVFGVLGGMLAEGIDYPGDLAIGAFIVGVPLPNYDWEREQMKDYYEQHYQEGMNYAYTYPAMAKAVQAAGRIIRSENDKGIIVLMDSRYLADHYAQCMPQDWFQESPQELVSTQILKDISDFWSKN